MASFNSSNKPVVLITGASSGIGASLTRVYAKKGANLILLARRFSLLNSLIEETKEQNNSFHALPIKCDVSQEKEVERAIVKGLERFGRIDTVIANAGRGMGGTFESLTVKNYRNLFETNVFGVLHTIYQSLRPLKESKGRLAILGSVMSYFSPAQSSAYCMSKFALKALAESLQFELKSSGVSVTLICPGLIDTQIRKVDRNGVYNPKKEDKIPRWLLMSPGTAAQKIAQAIQSRKKEIVLTNHGKAIVFFKRHFPRTFNTLLGQFS